MIYRTLGKTGLQVSILGYGASPLGDMFGITDIDEGKRAVHHAIENGINYFDVSPFYGVDGLAEARLGQALAGYRQKIILATKAGRFNTGGKWTLDFSAKKVMQSIDESLKRLKTDYIDIYQAHDIDNALEQQLINETLPAMQRLKEQGKIRFIGITALPLDILKSVSEQFDIDTILSFCHYNLISTSLKDQLEPIIKQRNIGLINASPLHMGLLTPSQKRIIEHRSIQNSLVRAVEQANEYCRKNNENISDLAIRFVLQYQTAATTLVGMSSVRNVQRNLNAVGKNPDPAILSNVLEIIRSGIMANDPLGFTSAD